MQQNITAQKVISMIETLPPPEKKVVYEWLKQRNPFAETTKPEEINDEFWQMVSINSMNQVWENQEEGIWDDIYKQQKANGKLQSV